MRSYMYGGKGGGTGYVLYWLGSEELFGWANVVRRLLDYCRLEYI